MRRPISLLLLLPPLWFCGVVAPTVLAGSRSSADYAIATEATDSGGLRGASANYTMDGSAGLIAGLATVASPAETAGHGYVAQLYEVVGLTLTSTAPSVNETATVQLGAWWTLDDATFLTLDSGSVDWSVVTGPIDSISLAGLATAGAVYENTSATVRGVSGGFEDTHELSVLEAVSDNFGLYAGDLIDDDWQVGYFGIDNPLAAPAMDPDGDGHPNLFEAVANLVPTDPLSRFHLRIEPVAGQPGRKRIVFSPRFGDRMYTVEASANLAPGSFAPLTGFTVEDNGPERTVTDLDASGGLKFYHVDISKP